MIVLFLVSLAISSTLTYLLVLYQRGKGNSKSRIFYAGIFYLILSIPFFITIFGIVFGSYFAAFGMFFLILDRFDFVKSFSIYILPIPILIFLLMSFQTSSSKNIFLIPEGYKGRILVVHGCDDGESRRFEGLFWRVYPINQDGVLFSKYSFAGDSFDFMNSKFFYVDIDGNRTEIPYLDNEFIFSEKTEANANSNVDNGVNNDVTGKDMGKTFVYGLWSIPHPENFEINTPLDFVVDDKYQSPYEYNKEELSDWVKKLERCGRRKI
jgi:hypothetical protein